MRCAICASDGRLVQLNRKSVIKSEAPNNSFFIFSDYIVGEDEWSGNPYQGPNVVFPMAQGNLHLLNAGVHLFFAAKEKIAANSEAYRKFTEEATFIKEIWRCNE
jgi:hypothetical protein